MGWFFSLLFVVFGLICIVSALDKQEACGDRPDVRGGNVVDGYCAYVYAQVGTPRSLTQDSKGNILVVERDSGGIVVLDPPSSNPNDDQSDDVSYHDLFPT